jgi:integrase
MQSHTNNHPRASGYVYLHKGKRGSTWRAKYRLPDGRRMHKAIGPAWSGKARRPEGHFNKAAAERWLRDRLTDADRGELHEPAPQSGATFADAREAWLDYCEHEQGCKVSTMYDYRSTTAKHLIPAFGDLPIEDVTPARIERFKSQILREGNVSTRTICKILTLLHGVMEHARRKYGLVVNPVADVQKPRYRFDSKRKPEAYSKEEVLALVRAARKPGNYEAEQDATLYLTSAYTGLRAGELLALRWEDVDFEHKSIHVDESYTYRTLDTPKSGKGRTVPMIPAVAAALADLSLRGWFTEPEDLVFVGLREWQRVTVEDDPDDYMAGVADSYLDLSALRRRYKKAQKRAGLKPLRLHDLRHTFGSLVINRANLVEVQAFLGHADIQTTQKYLHFRERGDEADRIAGAFEVEPVEVPEVKSGGYTEGERL